MQLAHKIRLTANKTQQNYFSRAAGVARFTYNWALAEYTRQYKEGVKPNVNDLKKSFNAIKRDEFPFVMDVHRDGNSQPFANLRKAFSNFFRNLKNGTAKGKRKGYPEFKSKKRTTPSFYMANDKFRSEGKRIKIPTLGWVKMREELRFAGKVISGTVTKDGNHWFVSVVVDIGDIEPCDKGRPPVGIDLGISKHMTFSDGIVVENQRHTLKYEVKLRRLNKKLSRQVKGSNNWWKTVYKLRQLHATIRNRRLAHWHEWTSYIASNYGFIGIEDLNAKGMMANHHLAKHIADVSFGEMARQLDYKQLLYGSLLQKVSRWFPSSQICHRCGHRQDMPHGVQVYDCAGCGEKHDRDENASNNILNEAWQLAYG